MRAKGRISGTKITALIFYLPEYIPQMTRGGNLQISVLRGNKKKEQRN